MIMCVKCVVGVAIVILASCVAVQASMQLIEVAVNGTGDHIPSPRYGSCMAYVKVDDMEEEEYLVLFGGAGGGGDFFNDTWVYEVGARRWQMVGPQMVGPRGRRYQTCGGHRNSVYMCCGETSGGDLLSDMWRFDVITRSWQQVEPRPGVEPGGRSQASGGIHHLGASFLISHGRGAGGSYLSDTWMFEIEERHWRQLHSDAALYTTSQPQARAGAASGMPSSRYLLMYGGCTAHGPCPSTDMWQYDSDLNTWTTLETCPSPSHLGSLVPLPPSGHQQKVLFLPGISSSERTLYTQVADTPASLSFYDMHKRHWQSVPAPVLQHNHTSPLIGRHSVALATASDRVFLFGGAKVGNDHSLGDFWYLKGDSSDIEHAAEGMEQQCKPFHLTLVHLHGMLMAAAWLVLLQMGAFFARSIRCIRYKTRIRAHAILQLLGLVLAAGGAACAYFSVSTRSTASSPLHHLSSPHAIIGTAALCMLVCQPLLSLCMPRYEPGSVWNRQGIGRRLWLLLHRGCGSVALILSLVNVWLGLSQALVGRHLVVGYYLYLGVVGLVWLCFSVTRYLLAKDEEEEVEDGVRYRGQGQVRSSVVQGMEGKDQGGDVAGLHEMSGNFMLSEK